MSKSLGNVISPEDMVHGVELEVRQNSFLFTFINIY
jgi:valyl-tRNA synthetase